MVRLSLARALAENGAAQGECRRRAGRRHRRAWMLITAAAAAMARRTWIVMAFVPATCRSGTGEWRVYCAAPSAIPVRNNARKTVALSRESRYRGFSGRRPVRPAALTARCRLRRHHRPPPRRRAMMTPVSASHGPPVAATASALAGAVGAQRMLAVRWARTERYSVQLDHSSDARTS